MRPGGTYLLANSSLRHIYLGRWSSWMQKRRLSIASSEQTREELVFLRDMMAAGKLITVIGHTFPLAEMAAAHRLAETGQKIGKIVIEVVVDGDLSGKAAEF